jgi:vanillate O-demethylase monooxygenase subunit
MEGWAIYDGSEAVYRHVRVHAVTPETPQRTHFFWHFGRDYALTSQAIDGHLRTEFQATRDADIEVLETIERAAGGEPWARGQSVSADAGMLRARRIVASMLAAERQSAPAAKSLSDR